MAFFNHGTFICCAVLSVVLYEGRGLESEQESEGITGRKGYI